MNTSAIAAILLLLVGSAAVIKQRRDRDKDDKGKRK